MLGFLTTDTAISEPLLHPGVARRMSSDSGERQEVSADELRFLAEKAAQASADVARVRERVQDILDGVDRRGWNTGPLDDQWARTRFGLTRLSAQLADNHGVRHLRRD